VAAAGDGAAAADGAAAGAADGGRSGVVIAGRRGEAMEGWAWVAGNSRYERSHRRRRTWEEERLSRCHVSIVPDGWCHSPMPFA